LALFWFFKAALWFLVIGWKWNWAFTELGVSWGVVPVLLLLICEFPTA